MVHQCQTLPGFRQEIDRVEVQFGQNDMGIGLGNAPIRILDLIFKRHLQWIDTVCLVRMQVTSHGTESRTAS